MNIENMTKEELEKLKKELEGKKLQIDNSSKLESEKEIVEKLSENARINRENIQAKREEKYEQMINDSEEIPTIGSRRGF